MLGGKARPARGDRSLQGQHELTAHGDAAPRDDSSTADLPSSCVAGRLKAGPAQAMWRKVGWVLASRTDARRHLVPVAGFVSGDLRSENFPRKFCRHPPCLMAARRT